MPQRVDKPSHSVSILRAGAHECQIRSAPVLALPRAAKVFYHAEKKTKIQNKEHFSPLSTNLRHVIITCLFLLISFSSAFWTF